MAKPNRNTLDRITLKGFKSIREMVLDLRPLNVLIGANGAGKSNLVSFFKMINEMMGGTVAAVYRYGWTCPIITSLWSQGHSASRSIIGVRRTKWQRYILSSALSCSG